MRLDVHFLFFAKTDARSIVKKESRKFREFPLSKRIPRETGVRSYPSRDEGIIAGVSGKQTGYKIKCEGRIMEGRSSCYLFYHFAVTSSPIITNLMAGSMVES